MPGLENLRTRLNFLGAKPIDRMNKMKEYSLKAALKDSYQSVTIQRVWDDKEFQCLINPDQLKPDYDNKVVSILSSSGFKPGDTFHWISNDTYWLVYLPELTETAYFRGFIRRCRYKLVIDNSDYYVYIQGPTESQLSWKNGGSTGTSWNNMSESIVMYIAKTDNSLEYLKRFKEIQLEGHTWQVETTDSLSIEGLIEVHLSESFDNPMQDLQITPILEPVNTLVPHITGEVFVRPYDTQKYQIVLANNGTWIVSNDKAKIIASTSTSVDIEVTSGRSGKFNLIYQRPDLADISLTITIESLL